MSDELSQDLSHWRTLGELPDLIPYLLHEERDDPRVQRRLVAAVRWEDERDHEDRRQDENGTSKERRGRRDRRRATQPAVRPRRAPVDDKDILSEATHGRHRNAVIIGLLGVSIVALIVVSQTRPVVLEDGADCRRPPRPEVVWSDCAMDGRNLNGADLRSARMNNMELSRADLGSARLENADLAYTDLSVASLRAADLTGARLLGTSLRGADLTGARLDHAVWIDGAECLSGSIGECKVSAQ